MHHQWRQNSVDALILEEREKDAAKAAAAQQAAEAPALPAAE